ncbi:MAG: hypothetical protein EKK48_30635 [Candidatus Melainabacteria bacterium]|nr:MAG: hypothetical protein EKK48_30635 [Candidatus Melainabacteria bacterium]
MELQVRKNSQFSFELLKEASTMSVQQIFPLLSAWFVTLLGPVAIMGVGAFVGLLIDKIIFHAREAGLASVIGVGIPGLFICGFYAGWIYTTLRIARQEKTNLGHLFRPFPQMFSAAMVLILSTIATALPSFTVIGAIVSPVIFLKFQLAPCFAVDQGLGPIESMKRSWKETNRIWIPLAILDLCFFAISTALGFTLIVPFAVFMVQGVATALVYDRWVMNEELDELEMGD